MRGQGRTSASSQPSATVFATSLMNEVRCQSCSNTRSIFSKRESSVKSHGSASKSATSLSGLKYAPQWPPHWKSERRKPLASLCRSSVNCIAKRGDASPTCSEPPASAGACTKRGSSSFVGGRTCSFRAGLRYSLLSRAIDTLRRAGLIPFRSSAYFTFTALRRSARSLSSSSSVILSALPMFSPPRSSCTHTVITICDCDATAVLGAVEMC
mmetsp:Transcript_17087/g.25732  ORF Transcript_17087/g.25732 Transcript_17087/m.25732 type:complete len:212 (-) Transcript_17087:9-644(-)